MSAEVFLDTNVLVYGIVQNDTRTAHATALLRQGGTISVQGLNDLRTWRTANFRGHGPRSSMRLMLCAFCSPIQKPIGRGTHEAEITIAQRDGLGFYDALIVASALEADCSVLWSEDMQDGRVIDGRLTIRNPFR